MKNHETMTLEELRGELAATRGWTRTRDGFWVHPNDDDKEAMSQRSGVLPRNNHPVPPTLDSIAAAMPEGWTIVVVQTPGEWQASSLNGCLCRADTEILARARLAVACRRASKETP